MLDVLTFPEVDWGGAGACCADEGSSSSLEFDELALLFLFCAWFALFPDAPKKEVI